MSKEIGIAAKMYEARRLAIWVAGEEGFKKRVAEFEPMFRACAKAEGLSEMETAIKLLKDMQSSCPHDGTAQMLLLASCVEIMEPSL